MKLFETMGAVTVLMAVSLTATTAAEIQTYKIGDVHRDGGIVFDIDETGTKGKVVDDKDSGPFTPAEAIDAAKAKGWGVPYIGELRLIYENLHKQGKGNFQNALYQSVDLTSKQHRKGISFADGKEEVGIFVGNKVLVRFARKFEPSLRERIVASGSTWEGNWSWAGDDNDPPNHSKLTVKSETDFVYEYSGTVYNLKGNIG